MSYAFYMPRASVRARAPVFRVSVFAAAAFALASTAHLRIIQR